MDFDYKKYSLQKLEEWMHDAISTSKATPQEIYDVIKNVVDENYHMHKLHASRCYELLALLNGNGKGHIKSWDDFWGQQDYQKLQSQQYTEEELDAMCDKAASDQEKEKCREYNLREAEYYDKRAKLDCESKQMSYDEAIAAGWTMTADGFWIRESPKIKKDKVIKWQLPVEVDGPSGEYFVCFPDDLMEAANFEEGDQIEWIDNGDGSYTLRKLSQTVGMDEC
jgi:hypothetical protein